MLLDRDVEQTVKSPVVTHQPVTVARKIGLITKCSWMQGTVSECNERGPKRLGFKEIGLPGVVRSDHWGESPIQDACAHILPSQDGLRSTKFPNDRNRGHTYV